MKRVVALPDSASNLNGQIKSQTSSEEGQANDVEILVDEATLPYQGYVVEKREITVAIGAMCAASWRWSNTVKAFKEREVVEDAGELARPHRACVCSYPIVRPVLHSPMIGPGVQNVHLQ